MKTLTPFLLPCLWTFSLLASLPFFQPYEIYRLLALAAALGAWATLLTQPALRTATLTIIPLTAVILAFALWCALTFIWSVSPFVTVIAVGALWLLPLWYLIFAMLPVTQAQLKMALTGAVLVAALMGAWALAQYLLWPQFLNQNGNIRFPFADPNNYAGLLNLGLFMALGMLINLRADWRWGRVLLLAASLLMLVALVLIGSRMAMVCTLAGLGVFAICMRAEISVAALAPMKLVLGLAIVMIGALLASGLWGENRLTALERVLELAALTDDKSIAARFDIWTATWQMITQRLWLGTGLGTFFLLYPAVRAPTEIYSSGLMAHADPLQFWAEAGLPALLLFYTVLLLVLGRFLRYMRRPAADKSESGLVIGLFCALLTLAMHAHVTFHLYVPTLLVMTGLALGAFTKLTARPQERGVRLPFQTPATLGFLALLALGVIYQSCLFSEMHARQATLALAQGDIESFSRRVNQAGRAGFGLNPRPYVQAASIPLGLLQTSRGPVTERQALFLQADQLLDRALALSPVNAGAYYSKALLYGVMGRPEVDRYIDLTLTYDPQHPQARLLHSARTGRQVPTP